MRPGPDRPWGAPAAALLGPASAWESGRVVQRKKYHKYRDGNERHNRVVVNG